MNGHILCSHNSSAQETWWSGREHLNLRPAVPRIDEPRVPLETIIRQIQCGIERRLCGLLASPEISTQAGAEGIQNGAIGRQNCRPHNKPSLWPIRLLSGIPNGLSSEAVVSFLSGAYARVFNASQFPARELSDAMPAGHTLLRLQSWGIARSGL
jgi:hypothetical protein